MPGIKDSQLTLPKSMINATKAPTAIDVEMRAFMKAIFSTMDTSITIIKYAKNAPTNVVHQVSTIPLGPDLPEAKYAVQPAYPAQTLR